MINNLFPGQKVIWYRVMKGGYGFIFPIPATVVKVTSKKVTILVEGLNGISKKISVLHENIQIITQE